MKTWKPTPVHMLSAAVISTVGFSALLWAPHEHKDQLLLGHRHWVSTVAFAPDGSIVSGAGNHELSSETKVWTLSTEQARELSGHTGSVEAIVFSPDGTQMATAGYDQMIRLWDVRQGYKPICTLPGHDGTVRMMAYSMDGRILISAGNDHIIKYWDVATGKERFRLEGHEVLAFSPSTGCFASRDTSPTVITKLVAIRSLETGELLAALPVNDIWTMCSAFSPDGKLVAAGGFDWGVSVYETANATLKEFLAGHQDYIISIAFSPDGKTIASGSQDRTVKLWNLATGQEIRTLVGHTGPVTSLAFAPDGKRLVSGSYDKTLRVWDLEAIN